jgi:tRNA-specific 2-thiouridylase
VDPAKDQSYFLFTADQARLSRLWFPLGSLEKGRVREIAARHGLGVEAKQDSQEICFVPDGDRSFLFAAAGAADPRALAPGEIVDRAGRILGEHRGLVHYTVGQRRGLGVAAAEPLYVLELDLAASRLVVGPRDDLLAGTLEAEAFGPAVDGFPSTWSAGDEPYRQGVTARIRHRHAGVPVRCWTLTGDRLRIDLDRPADAPAPGQALVLYDGDVVLGGGVIRAGRATGEVQDG